MRGKIGFLGAGNMAHALIKALIENKVLPANRIVVANRSLKKLNRLRDLYGVTTVSTNEELFDLADTVVIAVKPQDLVEAVDPLGSVISKSHLVVSLAAGVNFESLRKLIPEGRLARLMPNTPLSVQAGIIGIAAENAGDASDLQALFAPCGLTVLVEEGEMFESLTVACSSGVGFVFELMMYFQDWLLEFEFDEALTREMVVQTFLGAARLAAGETGRSLEELQDQVASKKGVTAAGLQSMRDSEIERGLRIAFEKAVMRDRQLAKLNFGK